MSEIRSYICPVCGMPMDKEQQVCSQCFHKVKLGESITNYCAKHGGIWHNYDDEKPAVCGNYKVCIATDSWNGMQSFSYRDKLFVDNDFIHNLSESIVSWFEPQESNNDLSLKGFLDECKKMLPDADIDYIEKTITKNKINIYEKNGKYRNVFDVAKEIIDYWSPLDMITADEARKRTRAKNKEYIDELRKIHQDIISACEDGKYIVTYNDFISEKAQNILKHKGYDVKSEWGQGEAYTGISWRDDENETDNWDDDE